MTNSDHWTDSDGRILSPRLRLYLYFAAGIILTLWLSLEFFGGAGFVAFALGMIAAQFAFRWRPSVNIAFCAGLIIYAATLVIWSAAIGSIRPSTRTDPQTPGIVRDTVG